MAPCLAWVVCDPLRTPVFHINRCYHHFCGADVDGNAESFDGFVCIRLVLWHHVFVVFSVKDSSLKIIFQIFMMNILFMICPVSIVIVMTIIYFGL